MITIGYDDNDAHCSQRRGKDGEDFIDDQDDDGGDGGDYSLDDDIDDKNYSYNVCDDIYNDDAFVRVLVGLKENSTIKQLDIRLTGVAKQVNIIIASCQQWSTMGKHCHWPTSNKHFDQGFI